jgi:hypothetical protein
MLHPPQVLLEQGGSAAQAHYPHAAMDNTEAQGTCLNLIKFAETRDP